MFHLGWVLCWILLILCTSARGLEVFKDGSREVTCSQGLSNCTMKCVLPPRLANNDAFDIVNLTPDFKLCCKDGAPCRLCMAIDIEIKLSQHHQNSTEQPKDSEDTRNTKAASVTVCYFSANGVPVCKQVEFTVNLTQREAKISILVTQPVGVTFSSRVNVYSPKRPSVHRVVVVPSITEACSQDMSGRLEECDVPKVSAVVNIETNQVDLRPADGEKRLPSVCVQQESDGRCQRWNGRNISLHSVTPCTCFQIWNDNNLGQRRAQICPFNSTGFLLRNVWENVSVSLAQVQKHAGRPLLRWNLSAPCRLDGEVWPCCPLRGCGEPQGLQQHLGPGTWRQNGRGHWERKGVFENFSCQLPPCVMVRVRGRDSLLGPYCTSAATRWRWSLLVFGATLLLCLALLMVYLTGTYVKKWVWKWHRGRFVKIGRLGPVLVLSPPDLDDALSKSVCELSSLLHRQGFSVTLDSCCRREQCRLGPIPWLYSQMMKLKKQDGRAVLVLTHAAVERALEWELRGETKEEEGDHPHSAIFKTSLFLINSDRQQRARGRFVLVTFDPDLRRRSRLPELLVGLRLFQLPSQTKALLTELAVPGGPVGTRPRALGSRDGALLSKPEMKPFICVMHNEQQY